MKKCFKYDKNFFYNEPPIVQRQCEPNDIVFYSRFKKILLYCVNMSNIKYSEFSLIENLTYYRGKKCRTESSICFACNFFSNLR